MAGAGLFTVGILLAVGVLGLVFGLLGFVLRALGVLAGRGQLAPHQLNSRRAAGAAFVGALCVYVLEIGGWPLDQLPPWVPTVLIAVAVVALLLALAGVVGARERDPSGVVVSLVIAGGGYALLQWQCYVPRAYFGADYLPAELINRLLPGVYIAMVAAGLARALSCPNRSAASSNAIPMKSPARGRSARRLCWSRHSMFSTPANGSAPCSARWPRGCRWR